MPARGDMLDNIETRKSALFFRPKALRVAKKIIVSALENCSQHRTGRARGGAIRKKINFDGHSAKVSYTVFRTTREPPFLRDTNFEDVIHGFIAIVELDTLIGVFFSNAQEPSRHLAKSFTKLEHPVLTRLFADDNTAYEELALASMSISKHSIRSKRLEADDLRNSFSLTGAGNSVPRHLRLRSGSSVVRVASQSGRVTKRDPVAGFVELVRFCRSIEMQVASPRPAGLFIDNFAEPVTLDVLPQGVVPTGILVPVSELESAIADGRLQAIQFGRVPTKRRAMSSRSYGRLLRELGTPMEIRPFAAQHRVYGERRGGGGFKTTSCGRISFNKKTITIRSGIFASTWLAWNTGEVERLEKYLNREKNFIVTFSDAVHAYYNDRLFRNKGVLANADSLLGIIRGDPHLNAATSEKGDVTAGQTTFQSGSLFQITEESLCGGAPVVICDDLDEEWADIIAIDEATSPPQLSFFHCKHKPLGLSASALHDIVTQALKNLGPLGGGVDAFLPKLGGIWTRTYNKDNVATAIARLRRGTSADAERALRSVVAAVNTNRRVVLVVSFLSKQALAAAVAAVRGGNTTMPQIAQLLWILTSFVGTCRDVGVEPWIICRP